MMSSYIAADRCVQITIELMDAAVAHKDNIIVEKYLELIDASKVLKVYIAGEMQKKVSLEDIERYGKEFRIFMHNVIIYILCYNPRYKKPKGRRYRPK